MVLPDEGEERGAGGRGAEEEAGDHSLAFGIELSKISPVLRFLK